MIDLTKFYLMTIVLNAIITTIMLPSCNLLFMFSRFWMITLLLINNNYEVIVTIGRRQIVQQTHIVTIVGILIISLLLLPIIASFTDLIWRIMILTFSSIINQFIVVILRQISSQM